MNNISNAASVTLDGTDMSCEIRFDKRFFSHKFNGGGVKYEIGVCIKTGHIVWINGPFRCGMPDITVARQAVLYALKKEKSWKLTLVTGERTLKLILQMSLAGKTWRK